METIEDLHRDYFELLDQLHYSEADVDYTLLEKHREFLTYMSQVNNSAVTIFDMFKKEHVFVTYNFESLLGYDMSELEKRGNEYFNSKVHPDDFLVLLKNSIRVLRFFLGENPEKRIHLKAINEYRVLNSENRYVRVVEQHQALELDKKGNLWLALGVIDISPNQDLDAGVRSQVINFKTGKLISMPTEIKTGTQQQDELSYREKQVLGMIKDGLLSKEISEKLFISVHTVNTHRQRILGKLHANNSQEAIKYASALGLLA